MSQEEPELSFLSAPKDSYHKGFEPAPVIEPTCQYCRHWFQDPESPVVGKCPFQYDEEEREFVETLFYKVCPFVEKAKVEERFMICDKEVLMNWLREKTMEQYA